jgi:hypothetical protein
MIAFVGWICVYAVVFLFFFVGYVCEPPLLLLHIYIFLWRLSAHFRQLLATVFEVPIY